MKKLLFILFFMTISNLAYADKYLVEKDDGSVALVNYLEGSHDTFEEFLNGVGLGGNRKIVPYDESDSPSLEDFDYWKFNPIPIGKKVIVDKDKKDQAQADKQDKDDRKEALAMKMGLSKQEYEEAKELGLLRG